MSCRILAIVAALFLILLYPSTASAHALRAECKLRNDKIEVEAYYDDDTPAQDAKVLVVTDQEAEVIQGRTDETGRWSFPRPTPGSYRVIVNAGDGHRCNVRFSVPEGQVLPKRNETSLSHSDSEAAWTTEAVVVSEGPTRQEFTQFPWLSMTAGLALIGVLGMGCHFVLRKFRLAPSNSAGSEDERVNAAPQ